MSLNRNMAPANADFIKPTVEVHRVPADFTDKQFKHELCILDCKGPA